MSVFYVEMCQVRVSLTHLFPMQPFSTLWKHQKTVRFTDAFGGQRKAALGTNRLIQQPCAMTQTPWNQENKGRHYQIEWDQKPKPEL